MRGRLISTILVLISVCTITYSQTKVEIYPNVQRYLNGEVSDLDRTIFFNTHNGSNDAETQKLRRDYNVYTGRGFWGAFSDAKNKTKVVGKYPSFRTGNSSVRRVNGHIATEHPANVARYSSVDPVKAGAWAANYYKYWVSDASRPEYFEPMNEPFVHANDEVFKAEQPDDQLMRVHMAKIFKEVGKSFDAAPELANMKVIGYSSAWPSVELWDFKHWDTRMKMFMDVAGDHMDAFATHLYDGINIAGADNQRSGSNADAILDLIETYSHTKWGKIVPHAISEFGGIEKGYGEEWSEIASIQSVKAINHIMMGLLEREDRMEIAIPFITGKAEWHITEANNYQPYGAVLWIPAPDQFGKPLPSSSQRRWVYSPRIRFYQLWSDVKGKRVKFKSSNPDIQVQSFADGNKLHVILSNLSSSKQEVSLNFSNQLKNFESLRARRLKIFDYEAPIYTDEELSFALPFVDLIADETVVLEYRFSKELEFNETLKSKNYYTSEHLKPVLKDQALSFNFNNLALEGTKGSATLYLSIGRKHSMSKQAHIEFNGQALTIPDNWAGYDQANRDDFFGRLEIPVPYGLLNENNTVHITFPDNGGRVSSLILNIEENIPVANTLAFPSQIPHQIPGMIQAEKYNSGGNDLAYHDATPDTNEGGFYRTDGVDIFRGASPDTYNVELLQDEWLKYTVSVEKSGYYKISVRVASESDDGAFVLMENDIVTSDTIAFVNTGSITTYKDVISHVYLTSGLHELSFHTISGKYRVDYLNFVSEGKDSLNIIHAEKLISPSQSYEVFLNYNALSDRELSVSFYKNTSLLGSKLIKVNQGSMDTTLEVLFDALPTAGSDYFVLAELKSKSNNGLNSFAADYVNGISVFVDSIDENALPVSIKADLIVSIPVAYQTAGVRDLVLQLYQDDVIVAEKIKPAQKGIINESVDLVFEKTPKSGGNYAWRIFLVEPGKALSEASAFKTLENIRIDGEKVSLENAPMETSPEILYKIQISYEAFANRELVLELWKSDRLLASRTEIVGSGSRVKLMPLRLDELPENGNDYTWKIYIIPISGSLSDAIIADSVENVIISDGTALQKQTIEATFEIFPNPATGSFFVKLGEGIDQAKINVYNSTGQLIIQKSSSSNIIELNTKHELRKGIYLIQILKNTISSSRKLVIH